MLEGAVSDILPVVVACAVDSPTDCCAFAHLLNPSPEVVQVHRGTRLERVEEGASDQTLSGMVSQQDGTGSTMDLN